MWISAVNVDSVHTCLRHCKQQLSDATWQAQNLGKHRQWLINTLLERYVVCQRISLPHPKCPMVDQPASHHKQRLVVRFGQARMLPKSKTSCMGDVSGQQTGHTISESLPCSGPWSSSPCFDWLANTQWRCHIFMQNERVGMPMLKISRSKKPSLVAFHLEGSDKCPTSTFRSEVVANHNLPHEGWSQMENVV